MYGVVLWSDSQEKKAVIWCEDHGDLAFYRHCAGTTEVALDAGDWVQFDLTTDRHLRLASNPRLISEGAGLGLAEALGDAATGPGKAASGVASPTPGRQRGSAEIIPFAQLRASRGSGATAAAARHA